MKKKMIITILLATLMLNSVLVSAMTTTSNEENVTIEVISPENEAENVNVFFDDYGYPRVKFEIKVTLVEEPPNPIDHVKCIFYDTEEEFNICTGDSETGVFYITVSKVVDYNTTYKWFVRAENSRTGSTARSPKDETSFWTFTTREYDEPPIADFTWYDKDGDGPSNILKFDATNSYDPDGCIEKYQWRFEDKNGNEVHSDTGRTIEHDFKNADEYHAFLIVYDIYDQTGDMICNVQATHKLPTIDNGMVDPKEGKKDDYFTFSIDYSDKENEHKPSTCEDDSVVVIKYPNGNEVRCDLTPESPDSFDTTLSATIKLEAKGEHKYKFIVHDEFDSYEDDKAVRYPTDQEWLSLTVKGRTPKSILKLRDGFLAKILDYFPNAFPLLRMLLKL